MLNKKEFAQEYLLRTLASVPFLNAHDHDYALNVAKETMALIDRIERKLPEFFDHRVAERRTEPPGASFITGAVFWLPDDQVTKDHRDW